MFSNKKYLINLKGQLLYDAIDNTIKRKRMEDPVYYDETMKTKAIMKCLSPIRGQRPQLPCCVKMKAFRFLARVMEREGEFEHVDLDHEVFS